MSHPDEALLTSYVDDALIGAERSEIDSHLIHCRECRTHVVALRDESAFLSDVLVERERPVSVREIVQPTEAGIAMEAQNSVQLEGKKAEQCLKLLDLLEDHDDVQGVHANLEIADPA